MVSLIFIKHSRCAATTILRNTNLKANLGKLLYEVIPTGAVDFLVENNIKGNFFNDFNSGAYLLGRTHPNIKVFIDGRTEVYGGSYFKRYQDIWENGNTELFEEDVEKYNITGAFLNAVRHHIPKRILNYLYEHKDWHIVYFNDDAVIFLRDHPINKSAINQFKINLSKWEPPKIDLFKLGAVRVNAYRPYYRAYTLESLELYDVALGQLEEAISVNPLYSDAHDLMGKIYAKKENYQKAFEHFRTAVSISPQAKENAV